MRVSGQNIWAPWPHPQTLELLDLRYSRLTLLFHIPRDLAPAGSPRTTHRASTTLPLMGLQSLAVHLCSGNLNLDPHAQALWWWPLVLIHLGDEKVLRQLPPWTLPKVTFCRYPSDPPVPACTTTGFQLGRSPLAAICLESPPLIQIVWASGM